MNAIHKHKNFSKSFKWFSHGFGTNGELPKLILI
jgi:hypothetical protein